MGGRVHTATHTIHKESQRSVILGSPSAPITRMNELFLSFMPNLRMQSHSEEKVVKERNGDISTTGGERGGGPFDAPLGFGFGIGQKPLAEVLNNNLGPKSTPKI